MSEARAAPATVIGKYSLLICHWIFWEDDKEYDDPRARRPALR